MFKDVQVRQFGFLEFGVERTLKLLSFFLVSLVRKP